jgi:arginyl-tRNA synthetase
MGDDEEQIAFRVALSDKVAQVIKTGMSLLGVSVPNRM